MGKGTAAESTTERAAHLVQEVVANFLLRCVLGETQVNHLSLSGDMERVTSRCIAHAFVLIIRQLVQQFIPESHAKNYKTSTPTAELKH